MALVQDRIDAILGGAGWKPATAEWPGQPQAVPARRHANARSTLLVAEAHPYSFYLKSSGRPALRVFATSLIPAADRTDELLRLVADFQDRLGALDEDRAFWDALSAIGTSVKVLRGGRFEEMVDWMLVDEEGRPLSFVPAWTPLTVGTYALSAVTDFRHLARETLEGGGFTNTLQRDAPMAVGALFNASGLLKGTPYWDALARGVSLCLTHADLEVRAQALFFFSDGDTRSLPGAERVEQAIAAHPELFPPGRRPVSWGALDFTEQVWLALQHRAHAGSTRASAMLAKLPDPFAAERAARAKEDRKVEERWSQVRRSDEPHPTTGETLWGALIQSLEAHSAPASPCPRCAAVAPVFETEESATAALPQALTDALQVIADLGHQALRKCSGCGALFVESAYGPPAADDLFARTLRLERVTTRAAIDRLRSASAPTTLTALEVTELVASRAVHLGFVPGLGVVSRGGGWRRYIYREGGHVLDAWYDVEKDALDELSWVTLPEFESGVVRHLGSFTLTDRDVRPFGEIPATVIEQGRARLALALRVLEPLADGTKGLAVDAGGRLLVRHSAATGWQLVVMKGGRVESLQLESEDDAHRRVDEAARQRVELRARALAPRALSRIGAIEKSAQAALARIDAGEACQVPLGVAVAVAGGYAYLTFERGHSIGNLLAQSREQVMGDLVSTAAGGKEPRFVRLDEQRARVVREEVPALLDPVRRWALFQSGSIEVGGGPTTDTQWILFRDGARYRFEGTTSEWVDEARARDIVIGKRYGWLKSRPSGTSS